MWITHFGQFKSVPWKSGIWEPWFWLRRSDLAGKSLVETTEGQDSIWISSAWGSICWLVNVRNTDCFYLPQEATMTMSHCRRSSTRDFPASSNHCLQPGTSPAWTPAIVSYPSTPSVGIYNSFVQNVEAKLTHLSVRHHLSIYFLCPNRKCVVRVYCMQHVKWSIIYSSIGYYMIGASVVPIGGRKMKHPSTRG